MWKETRPIIEPPYRKWPNNFYPNANFRILESRVLFWTSKVAFWRPDLTDVNTCAEYSHWREWLPVGVRDLKNVARACSDWPSGVFPWECVNMVMTLRYFAFRAPLITQARIEKSFWVKNSTSLLYLHILSSAETWKIFTKTFCLRLRDW